MAKSNETNFRILQRVLRHPKTYREFLLKSPSPLPTVAISPKHFVTLIFVPSTLPVFISHHMPMPQSIFVSLLFFKKNPISLLTGWFEWIQINKSTYRSGADASQWVISAVRIVFTTCLKCTRVFICEWNLEWQKAERRDRCTPCRYVSRGYLSLRPTAAVFHSVIKRI